MPSSEPNNVVALPAMPTTLKRFTQQFADYGVCESAHGEYVLLADVEPELAQVAQLKTRLETALAINRHFWEKSCWRGDHEGAAPVCMADQMWLDFSARYSNAQRDELEMFPKLKAAWDEWRLAWTAGADAALDQDDALVHRNEDAGPPDCPCREEH